MPKKTKIIFILTFIIIGIIIFGIFFFINKSKNNTNENTPIENKNFDPFGTNGGTGNQQEGGVDGDIKWTNNNSLQKSKFYQITNFAVAGASFFENKKLLSENKDNTALVNPIFGFVPAIKYVEKATGHILQMDLDTKNVTETSNSTIPGVYEVLIDSLANTFIYRYIGTDHKTITSFMAKLGEVDGEFLPSDIIDISLSPEKTKSFYLIKNSGGVIGFTLSFEDNKKTQVFVSSFSEWISQWVNNNKIFLTTKASSSVDGSLFSLDITNGTLTKIFGGVSGLTTLANNIGTEVLYGSSFKTGPNLSILNIKEHTTKDLNVYGLPEKCVWTKDNVYVYCAIPNTIVGTDYPDYWYQGLTSFTDYFVKINTQTKEKFTLANSKNETPVDATKLFLNKQENQLFFINKKDSTLWSLDL